MVDLILLGYSLVDLRFIILANKKHNDPNAVA
jgi:hypothetical protein